MMVNFKLETTRNWLARALRLHVWTSESGYYGVVVSVEISFID